MSIGVRGWSPGEVSHHIIDGVEEIFQLLQRIMGAHSFGKDRSPCCRVAITCTTGTHAMPPSLSSLSSGMRILLAHRQSAPPKNDTVSWRYRLLHGEPVPPQHAGSHFRCYLLDGGSRSVPSLTTQTGLSTRSVLLLPVQTRRFLPFEIVQVKRRLDKTRSELQIEWAGLPGCQGCQGGSCWVGWARTARSRPVVFACRAQCQRQRWLPEEGRLVQGSLWGLREA